MLLEDAGTTSGAIYAAIHLASWCLLSPLHFKEQAVIDFSQKKALSPTFPIFSQSVEGIEGFRMASAVLAEISRQDLLALSMPALASITDVKHLSSYNWIEAPTPTIAVPGSPALWSPLTTPRQLNKDSGFHYIAQNAARLPDTPLEPLFRALYITNPSFDIRSTDVVTDRNNIRKLHSFINPGSSRNGRETFAINVEVAKNTAIFCRVETATQEFIQPHEFKGFGHEFEKTYTTCQISDSTGHHRIISYRFDDLNFIVRHETDGYVDARTGIPSDSKEPDKDVLPIMLGSLSLSPASSASSTTPTGTKLTIKREGQVVPLESTLEIKTRVFHKRLETQDVAPQLWVSQTPKLVRAYHNHGTFETPEVEDVAAMIKGWEERNQRDLRKLAALIKKIVNVVRDCGGSAIIRYDVVGDKLVVWKADGKKMLPLDLYSKWDSKGTPESETNMKHDADTESAAKPRGGVKSETEGKSIVSGPGDARGKKATKVAKGEEQVLPDSTLPNPNPAKGTGLGSRGERPSDR